MNNLLCIHCGKDITVGDHFMYGLDRPYINIFFHIDCFKKIGGLDKIDEYLAENEKMLYTYINIRGNKGKK